MNLEQQYPALAAKIGSARQDGYGDEEIAAHIQGKIASARADGYSDQEINDYLGASASPLPQRTVPARPGATRSFALPEDIDSTTALALQNMPSYLPAAQAMRPRPPAPTRPGLADQAIHSLRTGLAAIPEDAGRLLSAVVAPQTDELALKHIPGAREWEATRAGRRAEIAQAGRDIGGLVRPAQPLPPASGPLESMVRGAMEGVGKLPEYYGAAKWLGPLIPAAPAGTVGARAGEVARQALTFGAPAMVAEQPKPGAATMTGAAYGAVEAAPIPKWAKAIGVPLAAFFTAKAEGLSDEEAASSAGSMALMSWAPKVHKLLKTGRVREAAQVAQAEGGIPEGEFLAMLKQAQGPEQPAPTQAQAAALGTEGLSLPPPRALQKVTVQGPRGSRKGIYTSPERHERALAGRVAEERGIMPAPAPETPQQLPLATPAEPVTRMAPAPPPEEVASLAKAIPAPPAPAPRPSVAARGERPVAPAPRPEAPKAKEAGEMPIEDFWALAGEGTQHKATGKPAPRKIGSQTTPLSLGESEGYSTGDIARFYLSRRLPKSEWPSIGRPDTLARNQRAAEFALGEFRRDALADYPDLAKQAKPPKPQAITASEPAEPPVPRAAKGEGGPEFGMGLGGAGEAARKTVEDVKGAGKWVAGAVEKVAPEGIAEYARRSRPADFLYRQFTRLKLPESKQLYKVLDKANVDAERFSRNEEHRIAEVQKWAKLTNKEAELVSDVIEGKASTSDPRLQEMVKAVREVQGRQNLEARALGTKGQLQVTEPTGVKRPYKGIGATYVPRTLKPEIRKELGRDITKFFENVRSEAQEKAGRKLTYHDLLDSRSPDYAYIKQVAEQSYGDFINNKKTAPVTKQALLALTKRHGIRPWQALQHLAELSLEDVRLARAGHLEYARRSYALPPEFYERNIFKLMEQTLPENRRRLEVIKALGQTNEKIQPLLNAIKRKNPDEYLNAKQAVELVTGSFQRAKQAKGGRELFSQVEYLTKIGLGTATTANIGQPGISFLGKHGLVNNLTGIFRYATEPSFRATVRDTWGLNPHSIAQTFVGYEGKGILAEVTKRLNEINGFAGINRAWNLMDGLGAVSKLESMARIAKKGKSLIPGRVTVANNYLRKAGIDPAKDLGPGGEVLSAEKVAEHAFRNARDGQLQSDPLREPVAAADKDTRVLYVLKRFTWKQFHRIRDNVKEEYELHPMAVAPYLLKLGAFAYLGGEVQIQAKHLLNQLLHSFGQAVTGNTPDAIEWWKEHDEENFVYDLIDRWASAGTLGMVTDLMRPGKEGRWTPWQAWRNLAFGLTPAIIGEGWRLGETVTEIGRKPSKEAIAEHGETGAWVRKAGKASGRYLKRAIPLSRMFEEPYDDDDNAPPALDWSRPRRRERRQRPER
ncbi:MAG: hypothetical protein V2A77_08385 [Pseudomonadota bacterium]